MGALRPTNSKYFSAGVMYDNTGTPVVDGAANQLNAYIPLHYARVKTGTVSEPQPDQLVFTIEFLNEYNQPFSPADGVCSIEMVESKRVLSVKYYMNTADSDEIDEFEEWLLTATSVTNLI